MMIPAFIITSLLIHTAELVVLDPALYLAPSPPLLPTSDSVSPEELWLQPLEARTERFARDTSDNTQTTPVPKAIETGRMFWPRFSAPQPVLGLNIPLTFSLTGSYGKPASPVGVIGNTYTSITGLTPSFGSGPGSGFLGKSAAYTYGSYGRSALAGSGYGTYGSPSMRIYGGDTAASWSGWGNGKWGHYGKG